MSNVTAALMKIDNEVTDTHTEHMEGPTEAHTEEHMEGPTQAHAEEHMKGLTVC